MVLVCDSRTLIVPVMILIPLAMVMAMPILMPMLVLVLVMMPTLSSWPEQRLVLG
jgi:hypothetical protein